MQIIDRYPIIITAHKDACRDFWVRHVGLVVGFDSSWFCWLTNSESSMSLAFMSPDHPSAPPGPEAFSGEGMCLELQVADVDTAHAGYVGSGGTVGYPLTDELFGQRRFGFTDPAGLWVDVVQQTEPAAGYWDRYGLAPQDTTRDDGSR